MAAARGMSGMAIVAFLASGPKLFGNCRVRGRLSGGLFVLSPAFEVWPVRMKPFLAAIALVVLSGAGAVAGSCDDDTIDSIADDGSIIVMTSGASFRVSELDQTDAMFWPAVDDVLICKGETEIINKNEKRERIRVSRIR
jgi:hypothetical protein